MSEFIYDAAVDKDRNKIYGEGPRIQVVGFEDKYLLIYRQAINDYSKSGHPVILASGKREEIVEMATRTKWEDLKNIADKVVGNFKELQKLSETGGK